ncbi:MAG: SGNH/GDSL hydrolase family protein [Kiritimatiellae bacterium]|jgi:lysophospholipase L1-like esterase|nr:SGNH/GDSL hydrolase family protein [Kiritimatiellia bacterium]MBQ2281779.1 SGNH/GDSL hydrolase family protein [Kiritimatiellia bacterium]
MLLQPGDKLVMIGDSVTDAGRARPIAEGLFNPYGSGYPNFVYSMLTALYPEYMLHIVNVGSSGNNVTNLEERWQTDVLDLNPDWVSIMIGVNDVWRQFDLQNMPKTWVMPDLYRKTLKSLIERTKPNVKGIFLLTPIYWELNENDAMNARVREYAQICREVAEETGAIFVDVQKNVDSVLNRIKHSCYFSWDRVHPNNPGHYVIARSLLDAMGVEYSRS